MFPQLLRHVCLAVAITLTGALAVPAQEATAPAYLAVVTGRATLERGGVAEPATQNMPFVPGDRLRTDAGRVEIAFPDGTAIEVGEDSEVEAVSATRVRLIAGTMDHIQRPTPSSRSATYLPENLQTYGSTFDQYGSWQHEAPYGNVWYPAVEADWRPYSYGSWSPIRSYGWTWVGLDAWAWPTHHYGRWGFARNAWFWIPGRTWGAAWVSWSFADDYVSWCPLGYDSRPVLALSIGSRRGWDYWTVPRRTFETRGYGRNYASYTRGSARESIVGRREPFSGNRPGRSTVNERATNADRRSSADYRRPSQAGAALPGANGGATRVGSRESGAGSGAGSRAGSRAERPATSDRRPTTDYRRSTADPRPTTDYRLPTTDYRRPTTDSRATSDYRRPTTDSRPTSDYRRPTTDSRPTSAYRRPTTDARPTSDYRRPTTDARPTSDSRRPTTDSRLPTTDSRRDPPRSMPHERAAPAGGESRGRAEGRRR
jgi:hypothetical protein